MTLVKHNPRIFNTVVDELFNGFPATWGRDFHPGHSQVPVNIHETADGYHIELQAAGRSKDDISINIGDGLITISFEKKEETENNGYKTIRREFSSGSFKRSFTIDEKINTEGVQAKFENGILKVFLPKKEEVKATPKQVTIS